jgi:hypothetical protein
LEQAAFGAAQIVELVIDPADGRALADVARRGRILSETLEEDGQFHLTLEATSDRLAGLAPEWFAAARARAAQ